MRVAPAPVNGASAQRPRYACRRCDAGIRVPAGDCASVPPSRERDFPWYRIWWAWTVFWVDTMYVGFLVIALLGLAFSKAVDAVERRVIPWHRKHMSETSLSSRQVTCARGLTIKGLRRQVPEGAMPILSRAASHQP